LSLYSLQASHCVALRATINFEPDAIIPYIAFTYFTYNLPPWLSILMKGWRLVLLQLNKAN